MGHWQAVRRAGWLKLLWIAGGERRGAILYGTGRDGPRAPSRAGTPNQHTRTRMYAHTSARPERSSVVATDRGTTRRDAADTDARFTRIELESGCRMNGRMRDVEGGRATSKAGRQASSKQARRYTSLTRYYANGSLCLPSARLGLARAPALARLYPADSLSRPRRSSMTRLSTTSTSHSVHSVWLRHTAPS